MGDVGYSYHNSPTVWSLGCSYNTIWIHANILAVEKFLSISQFTQVMILVYIIIAVSL